MGCIRCGCKLKQVPRGRPRLLCKKCAMERDRIRKRDNYRIKVSKNKVKKNG